MTEKEWFALGDTLLDKWKRVNGGRDGFRVTTTESHAFQYAWGLAWDNRKGLQ